VIKKNFLVIGGTGYIGRAIIEELINQNHQVSATFFNNEELSRKLNIPFHHLDLSKIDSIISLEQELKNEKFEGIIFAESTFEKEVLSSSKKGSLFEDWELSLSRDFIQAKSTHTIELLKRILPKMANAKNPNIVFIGSLVGKKALNAPFAFSLGKSCTNGLIESLSKELGPKSIKVNSVDPGMLEAGVSHFICKENKVDYLEHCALSRFGNAAEVAKLSAWLLDKNTFITGKSLVLDGAL
jgi:3-oxoacyl-[acyl-carrier protein] reductase